MAPDQSLAEQKPETTSRRGETFRLRTPLLKKGRSHTILAASNGPHGGMNIAIKCYAEGGENEFHTHAIEDHSFIVLQGRACFHQPDLPDQELGRNEGILLPAGAYYRFEQVGDEPLVLLRVGNVYQQPKAPVVAVASQRLGRDGQYMEPTTKANRGGTEREVIEGAFYE